MSLHDVTVAISSTLELTSTTEADKLLPQEVALIMTYHSVLMLMSLLSNGTIGVIFYKKPQLLTVSNNLVVNLACCDLGLSVLILPFTTASVARGEWVLSDTWCRIQSYLLVVLMVALHYSLLAISLDRNYAIVNSLRYPYVFTHALGNSAIAGIWVLGLAIGLPPLLGWGAYTFDEQQFLCSVDWSSSAAYTFFVLGIVYFLPFIVQCWCYLSIFRAALGHTRRSAKIYPSSTTTSTTTTTTGTADTVTGTNSSSGSYDEVPQTQITRNARSTECKAVKTILIIAAAYFICWTMFIVVAVLKYLGEDVSVSTDVAAVALVFLSCILNPMIYAFMNRVTRYEIWKFWSNVFQRLSGRPPPPFVENDDPISLTWNTSFSSGRQWATSSQRMRRNSKSVACGLRNMEMVTIKEETEIEEDGGRYVQIQEGSTATPHPLCSSASGSEVNFPYETTPIAVDVDSSNHFQNSCATSRQKCSSVGHPCSFRSTFLRHSESDNFTKTFAAQEILLDPLKLPTRCQTFHGQHTTVASHHNHQLRLQQLYSRDDILLPAISTNSSLSRDSMCHRAFNVHRMTFEPNASCTSKEIRKDFWKHLQQQATRRLLRRSSLWEAPDNDVTCRTSVLSTRLNKKQRLVRSVSAEAGRSAPASCASRRNVRQSSLPSRRRACDKNIEKRWSSVVKMKHGLDERTYTKTQNCSDEAAKKQNCSDETASAKMRKSHEGVVSDS